jgi:hypothetical protein
MKEKSKEKQVLLTRPNPMSEVALLVKRALEGAEGDYPAKMREVERARGALKQPLGKRGANEEQSRPGR